MRNIQDRQNRAAAWFKDLRDRICRTFEAIEHDYAAAHQPGGKAPVFERKPWDRAEGGGGTVSLMRGNVFEKVGVNISTVWGEFSDAFKGQIPGAEEDPRFWASGISLVAHMVSPKVPAVHMNTRMIVTTQNWFGGGADLTPMVENPQDTRTFHQALEACCARHPQTSYREYKDWCDRYFFLPHRNEPRGVGGIFFDRLNTETLNTEILKAGILNEQELGAQGLNVQGLNVEGPNVQGWEKDFAFVRDVGTTFKDTYAALVRNRMTETWTKEQREQQLYKRGRYVEFNLLHDRGTLFGLKTGGNVEAILMSLPPEVKWA